MGTFSKPCACCGGSGGGGPSADGYYLQATKCSDGTAADLWFARNTDGTINTTVSASTSLPFYFEIGGVQYYVVVGSPLSATPGAMASGYAQISKLTCCAGGKVCVFEWDATYNRSTLTWSAVTQGLRQCLAPETLVLKPGWRYMGAFTLGGNEYCSFKFRRLGGCCTVASTCAWPTAPALPSSVPADCNACFSSGFSPLYRATLSGGSPRCSDGSPYTKATGSVSGTWSGLTPGTTIITPGWDIEQFDAPGCANLLTPQPATGNTSINFGPNGTFNEEWFAEILTVKGHNARAMFLGYARRAIPDECCGYARLYVFSFDSAQLSLPGNGFAASGGTLTIEVQNCPF